MNTSMANKSNPNGGMTTEEVLQRDLQFRNMLLGRLQADCEYYLGYGSRNTRRLWAGSEAEQIEFMMKLYESFNDDEKPMWITVEKIKEYSKAMGVTNE